MASKILSLPTPLLLLVHLYILEYPNANSSEYNNDLFNPRTRGLRERAKTMEDITYFLVGKIEGKGVKAILPSYPCNQPSESLAFRTSLTKYLEAIRHQSIYPSSGKSTLKTSFKSSSSALWWKDVVVRKSLIEECSGEKFERLILSLSTHALMSVSSTIPPDDMIKLLHTQPFAYTNALAQYQQRRRAWTKAASTLLGSETDLKSYQNSFENANPSKYAAYSTDRLQAAAESKRQALLSTQWGGEAGQYAFFLLLELAGLASPSTRKSFSLSDLNTPSEPGSKSAGVPSPLPIAAAHHPGHLKQLRRPIFDIVPKFKNQDADTSASHRSHAEVVLDEKLDSEKRLRQTLSEALVRMKNLNSELHTKLDQFRPTNTESSLAVNFWVRPKASYKNINLDPVVGKELILSLGLASGHGYDINDDDAKDKALEERIKQIRDSILPSYPSVPDQFAPRKPPIDQKDETEESHGHRVVGVGGAVGRSKIPLAKVSVATHDHHHRRQQRPEPIASSSSRKTNYTAVEGAPISVPPLMTPSKSSRSDRRKSVRFSMAKRRTERLSIFGLSNDGLDDEVNRLVDETNDFPTDDEDTDGGDDDFVVPSSKTPTSKTKARPVINRVWTAGTPVSGKKAGQNTPRPRVPSALTRMLDMGPPIGLPRLPSSSSSLGMNILDHHQQVYEDDDNEDNSEHRPVDVEETPRPLKRHLPRRSSVDLDVFDLEEDKGEEDNEDVFGDDPPSMTLKDILLSADVSHFDLIDASTEDIGDGTLDDDDSFVWE